MNINKQVQCYIFVYTLEYRPVVLKLCVAVHLFAKEFYLTFLDCFTNSILLIWSLAVPANRKMTPSVPWAENVLETLLSSLTVEDTSLRSKPEKLSALPYFYQIMLMQSI